ncbi:carbonic anhydrase [Paralimibaculum aggregatum]|uniref:Carbonic anhydrase n=1 Tax=Paralimibaculum aggregatum TaxID=3036245 RepID=A0ABQ6LHI8_9RHOB|nr:carbonic anhydrase [Limibaculum sp. NKW23]GMG82759.1 carbonic anhydrase [Limibaculum sp. NKW23]
MSDAKPGGSKRSGAAAGGEPKAAPAAAGEVAAGTLPPYLAERFASWHALRFKPNRIWHARLAEDGQRPRAMIISCCDSRVDTVQMFGAEPGDLFVVRNVANLVPPFNPDHQHHGTSAAVEYAVTALRVAHILVVGHSNCGGVAACEAMCSGQAPELDESGNFIGRWMDILRPGWERAVAAEPDPERRGPVLEQEAVLTSLRNLMSFPFVQTALEADKLSLHGAWIDIGAGTLHAYSPDSRRFEPVAAAAG